MQVESAVEVEVLVLRASGSGLGYRTLRGPLRGGEDPDTGALRMAGTSAPELCHSTSWRFERPSTVVLSYAVLPDPQPDEPALPLHSPSVVCSGDPGHPTPPVLHAHHVVAHAVRHLAYLAEHDPAIAAVATGALWSAIRAVAERIPTGTHPEVHRRAALVADRR